MIRKKTWREDGLAMIKGQKTGVFPFFFVLLMKILSLGYCQAVKLVRYFYQCGIFSKYKLPCFVISIGNMTVGGTGKTPTAERMAREFLQAGYKVAILQRGYRGTWEGVAEIVSDGEQIFMTAGECGDEAYLLATNLPGVGIVVGRDRYTSGLLAIKELGAEILIMDDGFQHWQLERDLDVVLVDVTDDLSKNQILPRGTLREPVDGFKRADVFMLTKTDLVDDKLTDSTAKFLSELNPRAMIIEVVHSPAGLIEIADWYAGKYDKISLNDKLSGQRVLVFSAIGNPLSFENTIENLGCEIVQRMRFADHHSYTMSEMQRILIRAVASGVTALVTTEKDAVKLPSEFIHRYRKLPIYVSKIEMQATDPAKYTRLYEAIAEKVAAKLAR